MRSSYVAVALIAISTASGCTHTHLRWNTTHQARTLTDIYEQQVLDNLAMFVHDPGALPSFAYPDAGASDVIDKGSLGNDAKWGRATSAFQHFLLLENLGKFTASRDMKEAWTLKPIYDVRRLELMRCAYQQALASAGLCTFPDGCPNCDRLQRAFYRGDPEATYDDNPALDNLATWTAKTGRTTPACFASKPWIHHGCLKDVPKNCCSKVGRHCGVYVWIDDCAKNELSKLVLVILDYAVSPSYVRTTPTKEVTLYLDKLGELVDSPDERAIEIRATIRQDKPVPVADLDDIDWKKVEGYGQLKEETQKRFEQYVKERGRFSVPKAESLRGMADDAPDPGLQKFLENLEEERNKRSRTYRRQLQDLFRNSGSDSPSLPPIRQTPPAFLPLQFQQQQDALTSPTR